MECHKRNLVVYVSDDVSFLMKKRELVCKGVSLTIHYWPVFLGHCSINIHPCDTKSPVP